VKSTRKRVLDEIDGVLSGIDDDLRAAQNVRYKEAVDRLMDSAAQDCSSDGAVDEMPVPEECTSRYDWQMSIRRSDDIHANRMCTIHANCWDGVRNLDCNAAYEDVIHDCLDSRHYLWEDTGIPWTYCNADIYMDPPDGVDPVLDLQIPWDNEMDFIPLSERMIGQAFTVTVVHDMGVIVDNMTVRMGEILHNIIEQVLEEET